MPFRSTSRRSLAPCSAAYVFWFFFCTLLAPGDMRMHRSIFTCSLIYTNTIRFEKLCTRNTCVLMSWFHSHTRFQVSSIITCQFRTDVQNFFGRILSNSSHSVEVLKNPLTSMFNLMFLTTFVLKLFHFDRRIRIHLVILVVPVDDFASR